MKTRKTSYIIICLLLVLSCREDDKKFASIEGKWKGTTAEIEVKPFGLPVPFSRSDDSFAAEIEFKADGTVILTEGGQPISGTYHIMEEQLVTDINFSTTIIDLTGTYTIEELTATKLVFYLKKDNTTLTDPDTGQSVSGDIKGILYFERQ